MRRNKIDIVSLGCSKNLVDSEHLMRQFQAAGYRVAHNASRIDGETVMITPAASFYKTPGEGLRQARIAYVLEVPELEKAMRILAAALQAYPGRL